MDVTSRPARLLLTLFLTSVTALHAAAQDVTALDAAQAEGGWLWGGSVGLPGTGGSPFFEAFTVGLHGTSFTPGRVGLDLAAGTALRTLTAGALSLGLRGGLALPVALSPSTMLLPSAGVSLVGAMGDGGADGIAGFHASLAALFLDERARGLRLGGGLHYFGAIGQPVWLIEIGFVRPAGGR